jgi:hypothetical protein
MIPGTAVVRANSFQLPNSSRAYGWSPVLIVAGLLVLVAAAWRPAVPAVTGMALVALGATGATIARFRGTAALAPVSLAHLAIYGGLYALFVGAELHAAARANAGIGLAVVIDLAASVWPMAAATRLAVDTLWSTRTTG